MKKKIIYIIISIVTIIILFFGVKYLFITRIDIDDIKIEPITVMHYKLPVTAFRIDNFAYITDANFISEVSMKKLEGAGCGTGGRRPLSSSGAV